MKLTYFAGVRDALGRSTEIVTLPSSVGDLGSLREYLRARGAPWSLLATDPGWRFAVNRDLADGCDATINDGDEVAVFPPVTGG